MEFGLQGERVAEKWLQSRGWKVLQRRYRSGHRDIDLIAQRFWFRDWGEMAVAAS